MKKYIIEWIENEQKLLCGIEAKSKAQVKREFENRNIKNLTILEIASNRKLPEGLYYLDKDSNGIKAYM